MSVVKLQAKTTRDKYVNYFVTIPSRLVELLGWKRGDRLVVELLERNGKRGVFIYRA